MKRNEFIKVLAENGVVFLRCGSGHDIYRQISTGKKTAIPRHSEIDNILVKRILKEFHLQKS